MDEEEEVRTKRPSGGLQDLSGWSVAELEAYIARLEVEISRAREEIENKNAVRNAAEALFKKS
ncbi:MAG: DUF1192 domain-containing protein [Geminicoccaceae bacterium]